MTLFVRQKKIRLPWPYGKLSENSRILIALREQILLDDLRIAEVMEIPVERVGEMWERLQENKISAQVLHTGLPAMYGEHLPGQKQVLCPTCKCWITWVPCVTCCEHRENFLDRNDRIRMMQGETEPGNPRATKHKPGTHEKIMVMRKRAERGQHIFCDKDPIFKA